MHRMYRPLLRSLPVSNHLFSLSHVSANFCFIGSNFSPYFFHLLHTPCTFQKVQRYCFHRFIDKKESHEACFMRLYIYLMKGPLFKRGVLFLFDFSRGSCFSLLCFHSSFSCPLISSIFFHFPPTSLFFLPLAQYFSVPRLSLNHGNNHWLPERTSLSLSSSLFSPFHFSLSSSLPSLTHHHSSISLSLLSSPSPTQILTWKFLSGTSRLKSCMFWKVSICNWETFDYKKNLSADLFRSFNAWREKIDKEHKLWWEKE